MTRNPAKSRLPELLKEYSTIRKRVIFRIVDGIRKTSGKKSRIIDLQKMGVGVYGRCGNRITK